MHTDLLEGRRPGDRAATADFTTKSGRPRRPALQAVGTPQQCGAGFTGDLRSPIAACAAAANFNKE
jgi:hypothetical protein